MPGYILALDQGTTSSRAILFDKRGQAVSIAQQEFSQHYPQLGWVEHDPEDIWDSQLAVARQALKQAAATAADIAAIGITNQRETTIVWDRNTGEPVYNAIVWQCRRTAAMCEALQAEGFDQVLRAKTGLVTDAYFSGTKVVWILENVSGVRERAERGELAFGTVDSFLLWRLSAGRLHLTDVSNASRTLLFNIYTQSWDDEILNHLNIPRSLLPDVRPSSQVYGDTEATIFGSPIAVAGMAGDQQAATFGQACFEPGAAKNTYGTGCFMLLNTGTVARESNAGLLTTVGWQTGDEPVVYALEGSVFIAGAVVQWLRDGLGLIESSAEVEALAASVDSNGGVYFVPAFVGLGAPYWDQRARGNIVGLTRGSTQGHIARAALESIAYQTRDVLAAMESDAHLKLQVLRVDGGATINDLLMQFQADILGVPVQRPQFAETTALGAAYLAGLGVGFWASRAALAEQWTLEREFTPAMSTDERDSLYANWQRAVARAQDWVQ